MCQYVCLLSSDGVLFQACDCGAEVAHARAKHSKSATLPVKLAGFQLSGDSVVMNEGFHVSLARVVDLATIQLEIASLSGKDEHKVAALAKLVEVRVRIALFDRNEIAQVVRAHSLAYV